MFDLPGVGCNVCRHSRMSLNKMSGVLSQTVLKQIRAAVSSLIQLRMTTPLLQEMLQVSIA
jgi:hypothetical protein